MKGTYLGEFEEIVMLASAVLKDEAYAVPITEKIQSETGRQITISTVHTALYRLEKKGFLKSKVGGVTNERGGRRKRLYSITSAGFNALLEVAELRKGMWNAMPHYKF